MLELLGKIC